MLFDASARFSETISFSSFLLSTLNSLSVSFNSHIWYNVSKKKDQTVIYEKNLRIYIAIPGILQYTEFNSGMIMRRWTGTHDMGESYNISVNYPESFLSEQTRFCNPVLATTRANGLLLFFRPSISNLWRGNESGGNTHGELKQKEAVEKQSIKASRELETERTR